MSHATSYEPRAMNQTKIVFIGGSGRNGSTLLGRILGSLPRAACIGEAPIFLLDPRRPRDRHPCSCGQLYTACSFWHGIDGQITPADRRAADERLRLRVFFRPGGMRVDATFRRCQAAIERIYTHALITAGNGTTTLIDTTKHPAYAWAAATLPGVDFRFIHLIRDPRGVVDSWSRAKGYIGAYPAWRSTAWWIGFHLGAERLAHRVPSLTVRYEDFIMNPRNTLARILDFLGISPENGQYLITGNEWVLGDDHLLGGNPDKFFAGPVRIRRSEKSRDGHPFVTLATLPWLLRYRYPLFTLKRQNTKL